jgi:hypothetical protein
VSLEYNIVLNGIINSSLLDTTKDSILNRSTMILPIVNRNVFYTGIITFSSNEPLKVNAYQLYDKYNFTNEYRRLSNIIPDNSTDSMIAVSSIIPDQGMSSSQFSSSLLFTGNGYP